MQNNDDDEFKEDGSVWTSYSDLFTTVAVIFLVMFVFALLKSGVSKMQSMKEAKDHELELKGKVSESNKKKTQKKVEQVQNSLGQMQDYEQIVTKKVKELNSFVKDLQKNKKVMNELIEDQARKEAMLVSASEKVEKLDKDLKLQKQDNRTLDEELNKKVKQIEELANLQAQLKQQLKELNKEAINRKIEIEREQKQSQVLNKELRKLEQVQEVAAKKLLESEKNSETLAQKLKQTQVKLAEKEVNLKEKENLLSNEQKTLEQTIAQSKKIDQINKEEIFKLKSSLEDLSSKMNSSQQKNKELKAGTFKLKKQIAALSEEKINEQNAKGELTKKLVASQNKGKDQSEQLQKMKAEVSGLQENLAAAKNESAQKSARITGLESKASQLEEMAAQMKGLQSSLAEAKGQLAQKASKIAGLEQESSKLNRMNKNFEQERKNLVGKIQELQSGKKKSEQSNLIVAAQLNSCQENKEGLRKEVVQLKNDKLNLKDSLNNFAKKVASIKGKLRSNIAKDLANAFKKANLNVLVDNKTGNVVLLMDENFRFKKNSALLNDKAKETLKKIIPIYSQVLFGNKKIKDKIHSFNVVGHASPSFKGNYVEPLSSENSAYSYNMSLSAQRAASITNFIFGKKVGDYNFKKMLKSYTKAIGQGFTKPVLKSVNVNRSIASFDETGGCGPYDCYGSQRVELNFSLKNDGKSLKNIINMAKEVAE